MADTEIYPPNSEWNSTEVLRNACLVCLLYIAPSVENVQTHSCIYPFVFLVNVIINKIREQVFLGLLSNLRAEDLARFLLA